MWTYLERVEKKYFLDTLDKIKVFFWLIFNFFLMILTMHVEIMDFFNKILTKEKKKSKAKILKFRLDKTFL